MTRLIILALVAAVSLQAEEEGKRHTGVIESDSEIEGTTIKNRTVKFVDPGGLVNDGGGYTAPVISAGRPVDTRALNPLNLDVGGKQLKSTESSTSGAKDFAFGVSNGGADGLMKTTIEDNSNVVKQLTLPNGTTKYNPIKENGQPLSKTDLAGVIAGKPPSINLQDGTTIGKPQGPPPAG